LRREAALVKRHARDGGDAEIVGGLDFLLRSNAACGDELARGFRAEFADDVEGKSLKQAFGVDVGVEKCRAERIESADHFCGGDGCEFLPAFDGDVPGTGVEGEDK